MNIAIPGLDSLTPYLGYIVAGLFLVTSVAHRRGKSVPVLSALLDMLTGGGLPVPPVSPVSPVVPGPSPAVPAAQHPLLNEVLDLLRKAMNQPAPAPMVK